MLSKMIEKSKKQSVKLDSIKRMEAFVNRIKFPFNLSEDMYQKVNEEYNLAIKNISEEDALYDCCLKYGVRVEKALSDFIPIDTKDNDKRKRKKKVSLRIVAGENQTKYITISPGLHELLNEPNYVSFFVKDNVLAIGSDLPFAKGYKLHVEHNGYMIKSESLVDYLCEHFKLDYDSQLRTNVFKPFKTAYSDYFDAVLKKNGDITTVVFLYIPSNS